MLQKIRHYEISKSSKKTYMNFYDSAIHRKILMDKYIIYTKNMRRDKDIYFLPVYMTPFI